MNRKIFFAIILFFCIGFMSFNVLSMGNFFRIRWVFDPLDSWTGWHPGKILFDIGTVNSGSTSGIDVDGYLTGNFWLGNVGWGVFNHSVGSVERARVLCDNQVFKDTTTLCPLSWYAWSQNAGWIALSWSFIDGGSWVYYNPASGKIEGFGHSSTLGWVPFYATASTPVTTTSQSWVLLDGIGLNFIGKIAIVWNIAGTRIYNLPNQQLGYIFSSINHAEMLNTIRKNIALISRNIPAVNSADPNDITNPNNNFEFFIHKWPSDYDTPGGWIWPPSKRTIIVTGKDVVLSVTQVGDSTIADRALIVLKDNNGSGWNIIIDGNVKQIYAFIYAEGTIYSADKTTKVPYVGSGVWNIPQNQLYIKWAVISKNTIGWSLQNPSVCPVVIGECTSAEAQLYDWNYFRAYDPSDISQKSVPSSDPRFWQASTVIEYNPNLATDPPPGILSVIQ